MKSYYAYIRVSTAKQGEHGSSLQEQRSAIETYAAKHGHVVAEWFEERVTAAKQGRREFARMTTLLRAGKADGVIIHKIDRSARNLRDWAGLGELIDAGIEVLFAHEALDLTTRGGRLAADIQAVVAADFIRNLKDEVRKGFYGRLKQGLYPLRAPRGYLDRGKAKLKDICPTDGPLVRQAFDLYATGHYSLELLRHELARRGLTDRGGKSLGFQALSVMLRNPFYTGLIRIGTTGEVFEGKHEPLVPRKVFDRVQGIMDGRLFPRVQKHLFLFRRLLKCAACGRSLSGERQKGRVYYRCHDRACRGVSIAERAIEGVILDTLRPLQLDVGDLGDLRDLLGARARQEGASKDVREDRLKRALTMIEQKLARATDALIEGIIDAETFAERKADLLANRRALLDELQTAGIVTFWGNVAERFELGFAAYLGYESGTDAEKREILETVGSNVVVDGKTPAFALRFPFDELRDWALADECAQHDGAVRTLGPGLARQRQAPVNALIERLARHAGEVPVKGTGTSPQSPQVHSRTRQQKRGRPTKALVRRGTAACSPITPRKAA